MTDRYELKMTDAEIEEWNKQHPGRLRFRVEIPTEEPTLEERLRATEEIAKQMIQDAEQTP